MKRDAKPSSAAHRIQVGIVPEQGRLSVKIWAENILGCSEDTLNRWVELHKIPYKELPGRLRVIDAVDFWGALPYALPKESPRKQSDGIG